jgi:predicted transposase YbfD/YdcC
MKSIQGESLVGVFAEIADPRAARGIRHKLEDIIVISMLAFICGADDYVDIREYGLGNRDWLSTFLELNHGIPSVDTFERVFSILNAEKWQTCFRRWTRETTLGEVKAEEDEILAIDGKTSRRAHDRAGGLEALHTVSVWSSYGGIVIAQEQVPDKTNEITVIPELIAAINPAGAVVTTDAMGTQKDIAWSIREYQADYLLALKDNHPKLFGEVKWLFEDADACQWQGLESSYSRTEETSRDRHEVRECWVLSDLSILETPEWRDLTSLVRVRAQRTLKGATACEDRFYISSLACDAERALHAARTHWGIENSLHWVLDVTFQEDYSRARKDNSQANLVTLRHIALNVLKQDKSSNVGFKAKRKRAGWDRAYLLNLLSCL